MREGDGEQSSTTCRSKTPARNERISHAERPILPKKRTVRMNLPRPFTFLAFLFLMSGCKAEEAHVIVPHKSIGPIALGQNVEPFDSPEMCVFASGKGAFWILAKDPKYKIKGTQIGVGSDRKALEAQFGPGVRDEVMMRKIAGDIFQYDGFFVFYKDGIVESIGVTRRRPTTK
jgi:hypothetical protein